MVNFNCALTIEYNGRTKTNSKSLLESTYRTCILYIAPNLPCVEHAYMYMYESISTKFGHAWIHVVKNISY